MSKILTLVFGTVLATQALAQTPTAQAYYQQGQSAEKAGDPIAAKQAYLAALKLDPNHPHARYSLGQLKINAGQIAARGREAKFGAVTVPAFQLEEASLQEALDALRLMVEKESKEDVSPNFVIQDPKGELTDRKITMNLKNVPAKGVMKYLMDQTGARARYDEHAIVISPIPR